MRILTLVDVLGIQAYIFSSNHLKYIAGASHLVVESTNHEVLQRCGLTENDKVIFSAGGNALLDIATMEQAHLFAAQYSRILLDHYRGLNIEIAHVPYNENTDGSWLEAFHQAQVRMRLKKLNRRAHAPALGLAVTAECVESRLPATAFDEELRPISAAMAARRVASAAIPQTWKQLLPENKQFPDLAFQFPLLLDALGRSKGEKSYLGVVHIDGNQVGKRLTEYMIELQKSGLRDPEIKIKQRKVSEEIDQVAHRVMREITAYCAAALVQRDGKIGIQSVTHDTFFPLTQTGRELMLPIRPILIGGDDITFICDGRIALDCARVGLESFKNNIIQSFGNALGACAGVAIVKAHAPFHRAYDLAESLCASAKAFARSGAATSPYAMDWHIGSTTPLAQLPMLRQKQYWIDSPAGSFGLTARPYALGSPDEPYTFSWLDQTILGTIAGSDSFQSAFWQNRRNKIKQLPQLLRQGRAALTAQLQAWRITADINGLPGNLHDTHFFDPRFDSPKQTALLDAVELLDLHISLRREGGL